MDNLGKYHSKIPALKLAQKNNYYLCGNKIVICVRSGGEHVSKVYSRNGKVDYSSSNPCLLAFAKRFGEARPAGREPFLK